MNQPLIHPSAIIEKGARLGKNVTVEAFAVIKEHVELHDNVIVKSHAYIDGHTTIGEGTTIYPYVSIGTKAQYLKFKGETTYVKIGKNCEIREFVSINSSVGENTSVKIGDNCFIMAYCHIAHNSELGNNVIMSNNATLAGHVIIEDFAIIGGMTPIHQFVRIGRYAMVGGMSRVTHDIVPYTIGGGIPYKFGGLNRIGLRRNGFSLQTRSALAKCFKIMFRNQLRPEEALKRIEAEVEAIPEVRHWVDFCKNTKRGLLGTQGVVNATAEEDYIEEEECVPV